MRAFIVFSDSHTLQVAAIASAVEQFLRERGVDASADWYYDDTDDGGIEYGVKLDIRGLLPETALEHLHSIWQSFAAEYVEQEVRLEIPQQ